MATELSSRPSILLFGDSLTEQGFGINGRVGWASLLSADYSRRADVFNRGYFGYNSKHAVDLLPSLKSLLEGDVLFCTVYFGANDATTPGSKQFIPEEQFATNLSTIITTIRYVVKKGLLQATEAIPICILSLFYLLRSSQKDRKVPIIVMTPPPLHGEAWAKFKGMANRTNERHLRYGSIVKEVAKNCDCSVLDVWALLEGNTSSDIYGHYLTDGLHLNEKGNRKLYQGLKDLIRNEYPDIVPQCDGSITGIPLKGKRWDELC